LRDSNRASPTVKRDGAHHPTSAPNQESQRQEQYAPIRRYHRNRTTNDPHTFVKNWHRKRRIHSQQTFRNNVLHMRTAEIRIANAASKEHTTRRTAIHLTRLKTSPHKGIAIMHKGKTLALLRAELASPGSDTTFPVRPQNSTTTHVRHMP
jgi:hypothetical protein